MSIIGRVYYRGCLLHNVSIFGNAEGAHILGVSIKGSVYYKHLSIITGVYIRGCLLNAPNVAEQSCKYNIFKAYILCCKSLSVIYKIFLYISVQCFFSVQTRHVAKGGPWKGIGPQ